MAHGQGWHPQIEMRIKWPRALDPAGNVSDPTVNVEKEKKVAKVARYLLAPASSPAARLVEVVALDLWLALGSSFVSVYFMGVSR